MREGHAAVEEAEPAARRLRSALGGGLARRWGPHFWGAGRLKPKRGWRLRCHNGELRRQQRRVKGKIGRRERAPEDPRVAQARPRGGPGVPAAGARCGPGRGPMTPRTRGRSPAQLSAQGGSRLPLLCRRGCRSRRSPGDRSKHKSSGGGGASRSPGP